MPEVRGENPQNLRAGSEIHAVNGEGVLVIAGERELRVGEGELPDLQPGHGTGNAGYADDHQPQPKPPSEIYRCLFRFPRHQSPALRSPAPGPWPPAPSRSLANTFSPACHTLPAPNVSTRSPSRAAFRSASTPRS